MGPKAMKEMLGLGQRMSAFRAHRLRKAQVGRDPYFDADAVTLRSFGIEVKRTESEVIGD